MCFCCGTLWLATAQPYWQCMAVWCFSQLAARTRQQSSIHQTNISPRKWGHAKQVHWKIKCKSLQGCSSHPFLTYIDHSKAQGDPWATMLCSPEDQLAPAVAAAAVHHMREESGCQRCPALLFSIFHVLDCFGTIWLGCKLLVDIKPLFNLVLQFWQHFVITWHRFPTLEGGFDTVRCCTLVRTNLGLGTPPYFHLFGQEKTCLLH